MMELVSGMIGALVGGLLYTLGWQNARRTPRRAEGARGGTPGARLTPEEWQRFWTYDGSEGEVSE